MDSRNFLDLARYTVLKYVKDYDEKATLDDVFIVWSCKVLGNNKALLATDVDASYYEVTYNGNYDELYLDVYDKADNVCIPLSDDEPPKVPSQQHPVITSVLPRGDSQ